MQGAAREIVVRGKAEGTAVSGCCCGGADRAPLPPLHPCLGRPKLSMSLRLEGQR